MKKAEIKEVQTIKNGKTINIIKTILFITMLILVYFISEKFVDFILSLDVQIIKKALNIILTAIVVVIFSYKKQ